jgi:hypothetical protein
VLNARISALTPLELSRFPSLGTDREGAVYTIGVLVAIQNQGAALAHVSQSATISIAWMSEN